MTREIQVTFDAADPGALCAFWCEVLGYQIDAPPPGFETWDAALESFGIPPERRNDASAAHHPDNAGPRLFFQKVPEAKSVKNRVHLDVNVGAEAMHAKADELVALGATRVSEFDEPGGRWITLLDPEGNEFCVQ